MRNLGKLLFQRVVLVSLGILLQLAAMVFFLEELAALRPWFQAVMLILRVGFVLYLAAARMDASYKVAWLILILVFPVAGVSIYLFMGGNRLSRREKRKLSALTHSMEEHLRQDFSVKNALLNESAAAAKESGYLQKNAYSPVYTDTETEYFSCGEDFFPRVLEELRKAEKFIFLEYFIVEDGYLWGKILDILKEKAAGGVDVRLIYDDFGCITRLPARYPRYLRDFGISTRVFNPFLPIVSGRLNNRDHRKILVIDGKVGFTGGMNLADEYMNRVSRFGYWKDAGLFLRGDAVQSMTVQFLSMWDFVSATQSDMGSFRPDSASSKGAGFVQPFTDSPLDSESVGQTALLNLIAGAKKTLYIMTPYLVLDDCLTTALCNSAKSGVDVRIITPGVPDKWYVYSVTRFSYRALTEAGVKIYEFSPGFLHSKVFLADGDTAVVGTVNLDYRSLYLHFENAVWMHKTHCLRAIRADFETTFPLCRKVEREDVRKTKFLVRLGRAILNLFAPMM